MCCVVSNGVQYSNEMVHISNNAVLSALQFISCLRAKTGISSRGRRRAALLCVIAWLLLIVELNVKMMINGIYMVYLVSGYSGCG